MTLRVKIHNRPGKLGEITTAIGKANGDIEAIDIVSVGKDFLIRDITVNAASEQHDQEIIAAVSQIDGVEVVNVSDQNFSDAPRRQDRNRFQNAVKNALRSFNGLHAGRGSRLRSDSPRS